MHCPTLLSFLLLSGSALSAPFIHGGCAVHSQAPQGTGVSSLPPQGTGISTLPPKAEGGGKYPPAPQGTGVSSLPPKVEGGGKYPKPPQSTGVATLPPTAQDGGKYPMVPQGPQGTGGSSLPPKVQGGGQYPTTPQNTGGSTLPPVVKAQEGPASPQPQGSGSSNLPPTAQDGGKYPMVPQPQGSGSSNLPPTAQDGGKYPMAPQGPQGTSSLPPKVQGGGQYPTAPPQDTGAATLPPKSDGGVSTLPPNTDEGATLPPNTDGGVSTLPPNTDGGVSTLPPNTDGGVSTVPSNAGKGEKRAIGYMGNWDIYARNYFVTDVPVSQLTHLMYSFANVNNVTGEVYMTDEWADLQRPYPTDNASSAAANTTNVYGNIKQMYKLKKENRSLKVMLAILGYTYSPNMVPVLASPTLRAKFVSSSIKLMTDLGFDGLDIDYEYVSNSEEAVNMVSLLKDIREAMDKLKYGGTGKYLLSYASPAGPAKYSLMDLKGMDKYLDFWNFMGYDYSGNWDTTSGHSSNIFPSKDNPTSTPFSTSAAIADYIGSGISPSKINLGMPLYARSFSHTTGPGKPFNNTGADGSFGESSVWDTKSLPLPNSNATVYNLDIGASYSFDASTGLMISYDTPTNAKFKANWIQTTGLGGAMWWELSQDRTDEKSLVKTVVNTFGGVQSLEKSLNNLDYPTSPYDNLRNGMPGN